MNIVRRYVFFRAKFTSRSTIIRMNILTRNFWTIESEQIRKLLKINA